MRATYRILCAAVAAWIAACGGTGDYLEPELREQVEALKVEAAEESADAAVLADRLDTLWRWANAYSLTGGRVPGGFPQLTANANRALRRLGQGGAQIPIEDVSGFIERYTREFQIKDENPRAIGTLTLSSSGPFQAGEVVTLTETYTVGEMPMLPGGGIAIARARGARYQATDPASEAYVTVTSSNPEATFSAARPWGPWDSFETRTALGFQLDGATLTEGDTITMRIGDTSGGGPGLRLQSWSNDEVVFKTFVDLEGKGWLLSPKWPSLTVVGQEEIVAINAIAPSIVTPGEEFALAVRSEDRYRNLATGTSVALDVVLDGSVVGEVPAGSPAMFDVQGLSLDEPGVHRFEVRAREGTMRTTSNPVNVMEDPAHRIYWGETHGHTGFAEGQGSPDGYFRFGRDVARLDFISLSEHDIWMDDFEWKTLQEMVEIYRVPGSFTPILGFEWTSRLLYGGHHNVFFRSTPGRQRVPNQRAPLLDELYEGLRAGNDTNDVLVVPHAHQPGDWTNSDGDVERLVEIQSGHGTFDWFGNRYLRNGNRVGFIGASDNHVGHPGYSGMTNRQMGGLAAVLAAENSADAVFDGLRSRATYATTGERIIMHATLDGQRIGTEMDDTSNRTILCSVHGTAPIDAIDVIKNGNVVYTQRYLQAGTPEEASVQVRFESSTEVFGERVVPRGDRPWQGVVRVEGASIEDLVEPWHQNPATYDTRLVDGQVQFALHTRGRSTSLILRLRGATADTRVVVEMEQMRERLGSGGYQRTPQDLPAKTETFRLGDLRTDISRREYSVLEHTDALALQLVASNGPMDQEFRYVDQDEPRAGDYYYLRVRQVDGAVAWSSPFWVGTPPAEESQTD